MYNVIDILINLNSDHLDWYLGIILTTFSIDFWASPIYLFAISRTPNSLSNPQTENISIPKIIMSHVGNSQEKSTSNFKTTITISSKYYINYVQWCWSSWISRMISLCILLYCTILRNWVEIWTRWLDYRRQLLELQ